MTQRTFTVAEKAWSAEDMIVRAEWFDVGDWMANQSPSPSTAAMLRQGAAALRRWEALKAGVDQIHADWVAVHSVAPLAVRNVMDLICRLEKERPHE